MMRLTTAAMRMLLVPCCLCLQDVLKQPFPLNEGQHTLALILSVAACVCLALGWMEHN